MNPTQTTNKNTNQRIFSVLTPLLSVFLLSMIVGCTNATLAPTNSNSSTPVTDHPASTYAETRMSDPFPVEPQPLSVDELPQLNVRAGTTPLPVLQSSYCWTNGCRDFVGARMMLHDYKFATIEPNATIKLLLPYTPAPTTVDLMRYTYTDAQTRSTGTAIHINPDSAAYSAQLTPDDGSLQAPTEPGQYYYELSVDWMSADGKYSKGQTSFLFGFQVQ